MNGQMGGKKEGQVEELKEEWKDKRMNRQEDAWMGDA